MQVGSLGSSSGRDCGLINCTISVKLLYSILSNAPLAVDLSSLSNVMQHIVYSKRESGTLRCPVDLLWVDNDEFLAGLFQQLDGLTMRWFLSLLFSTGARSSKSTRSCLPLRITESRRRLEQTGARSGWLVLNVSSVSFPLFPGSWWCQDIWCCCCCCCVQTPH